VSTTAFASSSVIWSWSISLITSTPASQSFCTLARASSAPFTPQRNASCRVRLLLDEGPDTYSVAPSISPRLIRSRTAIESSSGAPRSRALVMPACSSCARRPA
jgi:hypothetical protein